MKKKLAMYALLAFAAFGCEWRPADGDGWNNDQRAKVTSNYTGCKDVSVVADQGPWIWYAVGCGKRWVCNWEHSTNMCRLSPWQEDTKCFVTKAAE